MPALHEGDAELHDAHLTDETLVRLDSGELNSEDENVASSHLECCQVCKARLEEITSLFQDIAQALSQRNADQPTARLNASRKQDGRPFWRAGLRPLGVTAGIAAVVLIVVFVANRTVPTVSANEIVLRAVREETKNPRPINRLNLRDSQGTCDSSIATASSAVVEPACDRMKARLQSANWDSEHWAGSFDRWRASLKRKKDAVSDRQGVLSLRTETSEGSLRAATLNVRPADFHAVSAKLEFVDAEQIEMSELVPDRVLSDTTPAPPLPEATRRIVSMEREARLPAAPPADPVDTAEIRVRLVLHELNADNGYETEVRRGGQEIEVRGVMPDPARRSEIEAALRGMAFVRLDLWSSGDSVPHEDFASWQREITNSLPPLADEWLLHTFSSRERVAFVNRVTELSRQLVGEIITRDDLDQRYEALKSNPKAGELVAVMYAHADRLALLTKSLRGELEPALDSLDAAELVAADSVQVVPRQPGALTIEEARILDAALIRIFSASRVDAGSLHEEIQRIRVLLDAWIP